MKIGYYNSVLDGAETKSNVRTSKIVSLSLEQKSFGTLEFQLSYILVYFYQCQMLHETYTLTS